ncbi:hypothetical protein FF124_00935 [Martelella lutilitoris]|uniref:Uncharacterized protein n=1 Tax=Martelella lutilitoris TaxID=2583532 RepID=A0A5C4JVR6_9HYPH|nr:hypothetical protein [Martelella lutilitoris]TNB49558.1 hypothetical protein FF124_00935 [Martelella lutilitoris]
MKKSFIVLSVCAALIVTGFIQPFALGPPEHRADGLVGAAYFLVWSAPLLPAAAILTRSLMHRPASPAQIWPIAIIVFLAGLFLTLLCLAFASTLSRPLLLTQGSLLSVAVASGVLCLAIREERSRIARLAISGMAVSAAAAIWSLLSVPAVVFQANQTAAGAPFCIAHHHSSSAIGSLWNLRGFAFYTTASGYKSTSDWYFHGILVVDGDDGPRYFNWSPRHFRFDRIDHPERFIAPLKNLCTPSSAFWAEL